VTDLAIRTICGALAVLIMYAVHCSIGVPRILQWRGFPCWGAEKVGLGDGSPPVGSRGKAPVGHKNIIKYVLNILRPPEAEAKCEISVQFLTFSCIKFWI